MVVAGSVVLGRLRLLPLLMTTMTANGGGDDSNSNWKIGKHLKQIVSGRST